MKPEVEISDAIEERIERDGLSALTQPERYYRAILYLEGEANNGAFDQFFSNNTGALAHEALAGLRAIGADRMAVALERAIGLFPNGVVPVDWETRNALLDSMSEEQKSRMNELSGEFTDYPDDMESLLGAYVRTHDADFRGPRTLLDMWRSKRARGADTGPEWVARKIDFAKEIVLDRELSSRPCPVCDYPSPDYRETCKKCGFPHGKVRRRSSSGSDT